MFLRKLTPIVTVLVLLAMLTACTDKAKEPSQLLRGTPDILNQSPEQQPGTDNGEPSGAAPETYPAPGAYPSSPDAGTSSSDQTTSEDLPIWMPAPGDEALTRAEMTISESQVLVMESFPPQFMLVLRGSMPTPCHNLRVAAADPDAQNRIMVEVYTVYNTAESCIQVLEPIEVSVPLAQELPAGTYTVWVNGTQLGEIKK